MLDNYKDVDIYPKRQDISDYNSAASSPTSSTNLDDNSLKNFYSFNWRSGVSSSADTFDDEEEDKQIIGHLLFLSINSLNFVTKEMLLLRNDLNIPPQQRKNMLLSADDDPSVLIGWQIEIDEGKFAGLHIVTGVKKTKLLRRTLFQINRGGDQQCAVWVQLQRGPNHRKGIKFRPLRPICLPHVQPHHHQQHRPHNEL